MGTMVKCVCEKYGEKISRISLISNAMLINETIFQFSRSETDVLKLMKNSWLKFNLASTRVMFLQRYTKMFYRECNTLNGVHPLNLSMCMCYSYNFSKQQDGKIKKLTNILCY